MVNSVFLYYCTKAWLDLAIVNTEKIERFASIPENERKLAENLLFSHPPANVPADHSLAALLRDVPADWREQRKEQRAAVNQFHIAAIAEHFRTATKKEKTRAADLPLDERLANYIVEGTRDGLIEDLDRKRAEGAPPLDIVNGPLMAGMAEVGRLFNANELIVAEVLQSAEAMKAAVGHLEQFMEKADTAKRGRIVLATVKGDVHDIGKNLVEIILKNNGYYVVNLGIKVPPRAADGDHRQRSAGGRRGDTAARRRSRTFREIYAAENRAKLRSGRLLRQRCDDGIAADERADGSSHTSKCRARAHFFRKRFRGLDDRATGGDAPNVVLSLERDRRLDSVDCVTDQTVAVRIEDLEIDQAGALRRPVRRRCAPICRFQAWRTSIARFAWSRTCTSFGAT